MNAEKTLELAHTLMLLSLLAFVFTTLNAYVWYNGQHLAVQILSHMLMLVLPVVFKLSYVLRLLSLYQLGRAVN